MGKQIKVEGRNEYLRCVRDENLPIPKKEKIVREWNYA